MFSYTWTECQSTGWRYKHRIDHNNCGIEYNQTGVYEVYQEDWNANDGDTGNTDFLASGSGGDWSTYGAPLALMRFAASWISYIVPDTAFKATWKMKYGQLTKVIDIPAKCFNNTDILELWIEQYDMGTEQVSHSQSVLIRRLSSGFM